MAEEDERMLNEIFIKNLDRRTKLIAQLYFAKEFVFYTKKKLSHLIINRDFT
jgi:hypothetical protein